MKAARKPIRKLGKKGRKWSNARRKIKKEFFANQITYCELRYEGCTGYANRGFAHLKKRINHESPEDLTDVLLSCNSCHSIYENLGKEKMFAEGQKKKDNRFEQYWEPC